RHSDSGDSDGQESVHSVALVSNGTSKKYRTIIDGGDDSPFARALRSADEWYENRAKARGFNRYVAPGVTSSKGHRVYERQGARPKTDPKVGLKGGSAQSRMIDASGEKDYCKSFKGKGPDEDRDFDGQGHNYIAGQMAGYN